MNDITDREIFQRSLSALRKENKQLQTELKEAHEKIEGLEKLNILQSMILEESSSTMLGNELRRELEKLNNKGK